MLHVDRDWYVVVEAATEPVLAVDARDPLTKALRLAFEVGNRHFTLASTASALLVPDDPAMEQLAEAAGACRSSGRAAVFVPLGRGAPA